MSMSRNYIQSFFFSTQENIDQTVLEEKEKLLFKKIHTPDFSNQSVEIKKMIASYSYGKDFSVLLVLNKQFNEFYESFLNFSGLRKSYEEGLTLCKQINTMKSSLENLEGTREAEITKIDFMIRKLEVARCGEACGGCSCCTGLSAASVGTVFNVGVCSAQICMALHAAASNCCIAGPFAYSWGGCLYPLAIPCLVGDALVAGGLLTAAIGCAIPEICTRPSNYPPHFQLSDYDSRLRSMNGKRIKIEDKYNKLGSEFLLEISLFQKKLKKYESFEEKNSGAVAKKPTRQV